MKLTLNAHPKDEVATRYVRELVTAIGDAIAVSKPGPLTGLSLNTAGTTLTIRVGKSSLQLTNMDPETLALAREAVRLYDWGK